LLHQLVPLGVFPFFDTVFLVDIGVFEFCVNDPTSSPGTAIINAGGLVIASARV